MWQRIVHPRFFETFARRRQTAGMAQSEVGNRSPRERNDLGGGRRRLSYDNFTQRDGNSCEERERIHTGEERKRFDEEKKEDGGRGEQEGEQEGEEGKEGDFVDGMVEETVWQLLKIFLVSLWDAFKKQIESKVNSLRSRPRGEDQVDNNDRKLS